MRIVAQLVATLCWSGSSQVLVADRLVLAPGGVQIAAQVWARHQAAAAAERRRFAAIAARADQQHAWVLAGDPRGTYGTTLAG